MKRRYIALCIIGALLTTTLGCISETEEENVNATTITPTPMGYSGSWVYATRFVGPCPNGISFNYKGLEACKHYWEFCAPCPSFKEGVYKFILIDIIAEDCNKWYIKFIFDDVVVLDVNSSTTEAPPITFSEYVILDNPFVEIFLHNIESFDILVEKWRENPETNSTGGN